MAEAERALYCLCYPLICTQLRERAVPRLNIYNFHIPPTDRESTSARHLETVHIWEAHGYKLNASVGAIMAHKMSGHHCYFHGIANNCRLLTSPVHIGGLEDLLALEDLVNAHSWTNHRASLMPDSAWWVVFITKVEFDLCHDLADPEVPMPSAMTVTPTMMLLNPTMTMKMSDTIFAEEPCMAWCQRNQHPRAFALVISTISVCSDAWPRLIGTGGTQAGR